jgi:hypothetical protein
MKIKVETSFAAQATRLVKIQVVTDGRWYDFGWMNHTERKELAAKLKEMAKEIMK